MTESNPRKIRLLSALLLVATFAAGAVTGAGILRFLGPPPGPPHHGPGAPPMFAPLPLEELELSADQKTKIRAILERHRPELEAILQESFPKVRAVNDKVEKEVRDVLSEEQQKELDELKRRRPPPPRPGGPPPPPGGPPPPPGPEGFGPPGAPPPPPPEQ